MKKMTTPKQLKLHQVFWYTFVLFLGMYTWPLSAQVTNNLRTGALVERFDYAKVQDNTLTQLSDAAAQLAQTLDSAFQIQDFKVFDFGLYLPTLSMSGELSFDQAVSNMYDRIETGGVIAFRNPTMPILRRAAPPAAYVFITHQFQGGGNVRFNMIVKIPGMSQTGADVSGFEKTLALAGQRAMEQAYVSSAGEDKVGAAKAAGLKTIRDFIAGKGDPFEIKDQGIKLGHPTNFVSISGTVFQLPAEAEILLYCIDNSLTNGIVVGFRINKTEWVAGADDFPCYGNCGFSGYKQRGSSTNRYKNSVQLNPGKLPISFVHVEKLENGKKRIKILTEEHTVSAIQIEPLNGYFTSSSRNNSFSYDASGTAVFQYDYAGSCSTYGELMRIKTELDNEFEIIVQKGESSKAPQYYLDDAGNSSIHVSRKDPSPTAKGSIIFTEVDGKFTGAKVTLNPNTVVPGRNDYKSTKDGDPNPLKQSENEINSAIANAQKKLVGGKHIGWNTPASGTVGRFHCDTMTFPKITSVIVDVGVSIYESASLPEQMWNEPPETTAESGGYPIHAPPILCGVSDGVIEEVTEIPQLVKMGVELASDYKQVEALLNSISHITAEKMLQLANDAIKSKWENYTSAPPQVRYHTAGKDGVSVASSISGLGAFKTASLGFLGTVKETGKRMLLELDDLLKQLFEKLSDKTLFDALKKDLNTTALKDYLAENFDRVKIWELLQKKGRKNAKLDPDILRKLELLPENIRDLVAEFSDEASGSTLKKFCEALDDQSFLDYVNNPDNGVVVRGFLAHKEGIISEEEARLLSEMLEKDEITHPKALEWMQRSKSYQKFKGYSEAGKAFEKAMTEALKDIGSAAYQALKNRVPDLDSRAILSQVQFCIKGDCINKGEYFVADLVLVKEVDDGFGGTVLDVVIVDTKLSTTTSLTPNQKVADGLSTLKIKSEGPVVKGTKPTKFTPPAVTSKNSAILKMHSDGKGNFQGVN